MLAASKEKQYNRLVSLIETGIHFHHLNSTFYKIVPHILKPTSDEDAEVIRGYLTLRLDISLHSTVRALFSQGVDRMMTSLVRRGFGSNRIIISSAEKLPDVSDSDDDNGSGASGSAGRRSGRMIACELLQLTEDGEDDEYTGS